MMSLKDHIEEATKHNGIGGVGARGTGAGAAFKKKNPLV